MRLTKLTLALLLLAINTAAAQAADVEIFFSPNGGCQQAIIKHIDAANTEICIAAYSFTATPIANALIRATRRGVTCRLVVDRRQPNARSGQTRRAARAGVFTRVDKSHTSMHQKTIIIDGKILLAGSYNYTKNAETRNSEILLVIRDKVTAQKARKHFLALEARAQNLAPTTPTRHPGTADPPCPHCPPPRPRFRRVRKWSN